MGQVVSTGTVPPAGPGAVPRGRHADRWARVRRSRQSRRLIAEPSDASVPNEAVVDVPKLKELDGVL